MKLLEINRIEMNRSESGCGENLNAGVSQVYSMFIQFLNSFPWRGIYERRIFELWIKELTNENETNYDYN